MSWPQPYDNLTAAVSRRDKDERTSLLFEDSMGDVPRIHPIIRIDTEPREQDRVRIFWNSEKLIDFAKLIEENLS